jgi:hypothetical protein
MRVKIMSQAILLLGLIVAPCLAIAAEPTFKEGWFTTTGHAADAARRRPSAVSIYDK